MIEFGGRDTSVFFVDIILGFTMVLILISIRKCIKD